MKKQSFLKGSVILIASAIIAKGIGALFKIPLTNMLGGVGMSYFSCAYGLFLPVYALTATGLTTAVAKLTAENCAFGNYRNVRKIHKISLLLFSFVGLAGTAAIAILAHPFAYKVTACPKAELSVLMIAPSVFFGCITAVYRGCWEGMRNMYPTAVSQVIEALVRLAAGLAMCSCVLNNPEKILPFLPEGTDILATAAAAAVLGISLSTLAGTAFLYVRGTGLEKGSPLLSGGHEESTGNIIKALFKILVPVALGSIVTNLTSLIDLATIIRCLDKTIKSAPDFLISKYGLENISTEELSEFIYGSFTGLAVTVFNLIPSVTNMFGKGILPNIAESWAVKNKSAVKKLSENVLKATAFIAVPSGIGICFLAKPILLFIFPGRVQECAVSEESLAFLGIAVIFLALSFPIFSCLQAIGRADAPVKLMLAGVAVKLAGNLILIPIPEINVSGAAISTLLCYFIIFILSSIVYAKAAGIRINFLKTFTPSLISGLFCGLTAWCVYPVLPFENILSLPISVCAGGIVYLIVSKLTGNGKTT
ncbi:putative polysaccharide biosynthesis protein [Porcipelethomonas sp.]|uniref:putative polysaccharide biosynthesis protein n=1 Tax=Porcipelethomonas sp. TaxID=2981675 RepID=UPI003EF18627